VARCTHRDFCRIHGQRHTPRSKLVSIDVRDCPAIGPKAVDMVNMLLPNCNILYLQGRNFTGH
jgi:hypothetical protein